MTAKLTYVITPLAGDWIAGYRRPAGGTIDLLPIEAEYDLRAGTLAPLGTPIVEPAPTPAILPTDQLPVQRYGQTKEVLFSELIEFLVLNYPAFVAGLTAEIAAVRTIAEGRVSQAGLMQTVVALRTSLLNGADAAHDTFGEVQVLLQANDGAIQAIMTAIGARLVAGNNLSEIATAGAQAQAETRTNLGLGEIATMSRADVIAAVRDALEGKEF